MSESETNEFNPMDFSQYQTEIPIPLSERIQTAVNTVIQMMSVALSNFLLAPVFFFRALFTKTQKVIDLTKLPKGHPLLAQAGMAEPEPIQHEHRIVENKDEEDWLKEHRENYPDE